MSMQSTEQQSEVDAVYWKSRIVGLEFLICELLTDNEQLRSELQTGKPEAKLSNGLTPFKISIGSAAGFC
jgi:hypothetical protein